MAHSEHCQKCLAIKKVCQVDLFKNKKIKITPSKIFLKYRIYTWTGRMRTNERNRYRQPDNPDSNRKCKKDDISQKQLT